MDDTSVPSYRKLLAAISAIYSDFFESADYHTTFESLLKNLLEANTAS